MRHCGTLCPDQCAFALGRTLVLVVGWAEACLWKGQSMESLECVCGEGSPVNGISGSLRGSATSFCMHVHALERFHEHKASFHICTRDPSKYPPSSRIIPEVNPASSSFLHFYFFIFIFLLR